MNQQDQYRYLVFLSHNSSDKPAVKVLERKLEASGVSTFMDDGDLMAGESWMPALERGLAESETCVVFIGPHGQGKWQNQEVQLALDKQTERNDYRVISVLLPGSHDSQVEGFLKLRTWIDFRAGLDDEGSFERLVSAIRGVAPQSGKGLLELDDEPRPYRGIERFEGEQQQFFYGRDDEIQRLIERLEMEHFVAVVGASGSGKSSLVRAGLYTDTAEAAQRGIRDWRRIIMLPKMNPLLELASQLVAHLPESERLPRIKTFIEDFLQSPDGLVTALKSLFSAPEQPVLLIVDQFEELFTQRPPLDRNQIDWRKRNESFAKNLLNLVEQSPEWLRIVVTLRADFVDHFVGGDIREYRALLERRQFWLGGMDDNDLREVIVRPATQRGAFLEKGLVERIINEMHGEDLALPLLEEALSMLWERRRGPWLTHEAFEGIGGVGGALADKADSIFNNLSPRQQAIARRVFLKLVQLGEGTRDTRRRVSLSSLKSVTDDESEFEDVLTRFSQKGVRLITFSSVKAQLAKEDDLHEELAEVTHEALIDHWDQLTAWLETNRDDARLERRMEEAARMWKDESEKPHGNPDGLLWRPPNLELARAYVERIEGALPALLLDFYEASEQQERRKLEQEAERIREKERSRKRFQRIAGVAAIVACVAIGLFIYALVQKHYAFAQKQEADRQRDAAATAFERYFNLFRNTLHVGSSVFDELAAPDEESPAELRRLVSTYDDHVIVTSEEIQTRIIELQTLVNDPDSNLDMNDIRKAVIRISTACKTAWNSELRELEIQLEGDQEKVGYLGQLTFIMVEPAYRRLTQVVMKLKAGSWEVSDINEFEKLYWCDLPLFETREIESAMINIRDALDRNGNGELIDRGKLDDSPAPLDIKLIENLENVWAPLLENAGIEPVKLID